MEKVVGIRFRRGGKVYYFSCGTLGLKKGDYVIVHTEQGMGLGEIVEGPYQRDPRFHPKQMKQVDRLAKEDEIRKYFDNMHYESQAREYCLERIHAHGLPMNLVGVEYFYDGSKIIFFFTAEGRVDFRELVKDLVRRFRTRVELKQIGVRNQAKMVGGLGTCGRALCCATFLRNFHPVSIKMAKEQNLSLNPSKISGACGRLMCCLQYEHETYRRCRKNMPKLGKKIEIEAGRGKVIRQHILQRKAIVLLENGREVELDLGPVPGDSEPGQGQPAPPKPAERKRKSRKPKGRKPAANKAGDRPASDKKSGSRKSGGRKRRK